MNRPLNHPFAFGMLAWVVLSSVLVGAGVLSSGPRPSAGEEAAARGASWFAVADPYTKVIDPAHALTIRQSHVTAVQAVPSRVLERDAPGDGYASMEWVSDRDLHVRTVDGRVLSVRVDPHTGQPLNQVRPGRVADD